MARFYTSQRRGRPVSYQAFLAGPLEDMVGAETSVNAQMNSAESAGRAIVIGVVTGALTLLVNRWLERFLR